MKPVVNSLWKRHVHLDFHTSELIDGIGSRFSKHNFQDALKTAHLDAITVFAKCHHGWCYFPTQVGKRHPHLEIDLMGDQIAACHDIGVRAPIYVTVGWSAQDASNNPDWICRDKDGNPRVSNVDAKAAPGDPRPDYSWVFLCPSGGYLQHLKDLTQEICDSYPVDGFFYDICQCWLGPCYCDNCRSGMAAAGVNPDNVADATTYSVVMRWMNAMKTLNAVIESRHPDATVFYNGNAEASSDPKIWKNLTHFELEDLPTTWGGYNKFPLRAKFFMKQGKDRLAMSGKFHTSWGEFGGFKHPDAIRFEAASMVSFGASCSFGDQAHPSGEMELATYRNIGEAYRYVEQIEEFATDASSFSSLGLWRCGQIPQDQGVANMLLETQRDFDIVGGHDDLSQYETIILPGGRCMNDASASKLSAFIQQGGKILALNESVLDHDGKKFLLDVGADYAGPGAYELDYLRADSALAEDLPDAPFLNYSSALKTIIKDGETLAWIHEPYFNRTYGAYCSHMNTPFRLERAGHPGAVRKGNIVYLPHPLGQLYYKHGARVHRQLFANALALVHERPVVTVGLPSAGRVNVLKQAKMKRYVVHLLYGAPIQRGRCQVIEDLPTLHNVPVSLRIPETIRNVYLAPQRTDVSLRRNDGTASVTIPELCCHQAIVFEY